MLHVLMEYPRLGLLPRLLLHWLSSGLDLWLALHLRLALHWRLAPHLWLARLSLRRRLRAEASARGMKKRCAALVRIAVTAHLLPGSQASGKHHHVGSKAWLELGLPRGCFPVPPLSPPTSVASGLKADPPVIQFPRSLRPRSFCIMALPRSRFRHGSWRAPGGTALRSTTTSSLAIRPSLSIMAQAAGAAPWCGCDSDVHVYPRGALVPSAAHQVTPTSSSRRGARDLDGAGNPTHLSGAARPLFASSQHAGGWILWKSPERHTFHHLTCHAGWAALGPPHLCLHAPIPPCLRGSGDNASQSTLCAR